MQAGPTLHVKNLRGYMQAVAKLEPDTRRAARKPFREVGNLVKVDAQARTATQSPRSARGYRVYVRQRGVSVEQSLRRTTGLHPEWGVWQMTHSFIPAAIQNEDQLVRGMEQAVATAGVIFARGGL